MDAIRSLSLGLDRESTVGRLRPWVWVAVAVVSAFWLLAPRASGWQLLHLHKEDGAIFLQQWVSDGWTSMFKPYTGYQHLGARLATGVCAAGPVSWLAPCVGVAAGTFRLALAVVAGAVLAPYARTRWWGLAAGLLFVFVPVGQQEVLGNVTNLRWFFDAGCLLICVGLFRGWLAVLAGVLGFIGAMSDPLVLLLIPLAAWRVITAPERKLVMPAVAVAAGAVVHWLLLIPSARAADFGWYAREPVEATGQLLIRALAVAQFGQNGTEVLLYASIALAAMAGSVPLAIIAMSRPPGAPSVLVVLLLLSGVSLLAATLLFAPHEQLELNPAWQLGTASRYSVGPALLISGALLVAVSHAQRPLLHWVAASLMAVAAVGDMTGDSWNSHGPTWAESVDSALERCGTNTKTVEVQLTPTDVPTEWRADLSCEWLAAGAEGWSR